MVAFAVASTASNFLKNFPSNSSTFNLAITLQFLKLELIPFITKQWSLVSIYPSSSNTVVNLEFIGIRKERVL